jgi:hypothetical protein
LSSDGFAGKFVYTLHKVINQLTICWVGHRNDKRWVNLQILLFIVVVTWVLLSLLSLRLRGIMVGFRWL